MPRFEEVTEEVNEILQEVIEENFPQLEGAAIKSIFDTKKRKSGNDYTLGRTKKCSEFEKYLSADNIHPNGYNYFIYLDKNTWSEIPRSDKKRLLFHELCHMEVDFEKKDPYMTKKHEIEGFHAELEYNKDDPDWGQRLANIAESIYEKE